MSKLSKATLNKIVIALIILFSIKLWGYFTLSENINITRVLKIIMRLSSTGGIILIYKFLKDRGHVPSIQFSNILVPALYFAYLLFGFCSMLWSTNPFYSFLQLFMTLESTFFIYFFLKIDVLIRTYYPDFHFSPMRIIAHSCLGISAIFILGIFIAPDQFYRLTHGGEVARLGGYLMNPNELGMLTVIGMATLLLSVEDFKLLSRDNLYQLVLLSALLLTGSRSSLIGLALVLMYFTYKVDNPKLKALILISGIAVTPILVNTIIIKQGDLEEVLSMTGRLPFWTALLNEGLPKEPWHGFGFMRIAYGDTFQSVHTYAGKMTHNTFIQVLMNLGFIGFGIVCLQMMALTYAFFKSQITERRLLFIALIIPLVINSLTEFGIFGENNFGILFYQLLCGVFCINFYSKFNVYERIQLKKAGWDLNQLSSPQK